MNKYIITNKIMKFSIYKIVIIEFKFFERIIYKGYKCERARATTLLGPFSNE